MKVHFNQLFKSSNGSLRSKVALRINNRTRSAGEILKEKQLLAGITIDYCIGKYFEVEEQGGVINVKGVYDGSFIDRNAS